MHRIRSAAALAAVLALALPAAAFAHAHLSPPVVVAGEGQVFTLAVPTEEEDATTTSVKLTPGEGFSIGEFLPSPGWKRTVDSTGSGEEAVVKSVTWTGGAVPTGEATSLQFLGTAKDQGNVTFDVEQTYSNGTVVTWDGDESSDTPAVTIEALSSFGGGGGSSTLAIVALVVAGIAVVLGGMALLGGRRELG